MKIKVEIWCDDADELARVGKAVNEAVRPGQAAPFPTLPEQQAASMYPSMPMTAPEVFPDNTVEEVQDEQSEPVDKSLESMKNFLGGTNTPPKHITATEVASTVEPAAAASQPKSKGKGRGKKTSTEVAESVADTVNQTAVVAQPAQQPMIPANNNGAPSPNTPLGDEPYNFYSFKEFSGTFAIILARLIKENYISQEDVETYTKEYELPFIYAMKNDMAKMERFFNELINRGIIVRKGEY